MQLNRKSPVRLVAERRLRPSWEPDDAGRQDRPHDEIPADREDLPYRVELWDAARTAVEQVLAVTANGSIGYAAYYAATREFPSRYVTLRHKNSIISRWNGPGH
jgi:hypothetical protein